MPGLAGAMGILDLTGRQNGAKFGAEKAHRMVLVPAVGEKRRASIMWPGEIFYSNNVGACGAVSSGAFCGRLSRAVQRWAISLVRQGNFPLLFPDDALVLQEDDVSDIDLAIGISCIRLPGFPPIDNEFWG